MRKPRKQSCAVVGGLALLLLLGDNTSAQQCPEGQVWTGSKCAWLNLCPDGTVWRGTQCRNGTQRVVREPQQELPRQPVDTPPAPRQDKKDACLCEREFRVGARAGDDRRVLLTDGLGKDLFVAYLRQLKDSRLKVDLAELGVYYSRGGQIRKLQGGVNVTLGFGEAMVGRTMRDKWLEALTGISAERICGAETTARELGADLMCGRARRP